MRPFPGQKRETKVLLVVPGSLDGRSESCRRIRLARGTRDELVCSGIPWAICRARIRRPSAHYLYDGVNRLLSANHGAILRAKSGRPQGSQVRAFPYGWRRITYWRISKGLRIRVSV